MDSNYYPYLDIILMLPVHHHLDEHMNEGLTNLADAILMQGESFKKEEEATVKNNLLVQYVLSKKVTDCLS